VGLFAGAALAAYPYAYGYTDPYAYGGYGYPYAYGNAYPYAYGSAYPYAYPYQAPAYAPAATGGAPAAMSYGLAATGASLWYYCQNPAGYYPYVQQCPTQWQPVPGRPAG
jgi:hypothetical protein